MKNPLAQSLWPACLSALQLDRYLLGELSGAAAEEVRAHLDGCARCKAAASTMRPEPLPRLRLLRAPRPRWHRAAAAAAGLAAAASLVIVLRPAPGERPKGNGIALTMYVKHGSEVRRAGPGETVAPGDSVRFAATTPAAAYVAVLSIDPRGHGSVYYPLGPRAESVPAGADVPLPLGTRLDATVGEEKIVGLFCASPVELDPLRARLEQGGIEIPDGCQVTQWSFVKR